MTSPDPVSDPNPTVARRGARAFTGVVLVLIGSLTLLGLVFIGNDSSRFSEHLLFSLGLALTSLISGTAQVLILVGLALLWGARKPAPPA